MLEVNLHPDRERQEKGGVLSDLEFEVPEWVSVGDLTADPWTTAVAVAGLLFLAGVGGSWYQLQTRADRLDRRLESALADSARLAELRTLSDSLRGQREAIQGRLRLVKELDGNRYVWPHLMSELSRALPEVVWLTDVQRTAPLPNLRVRLRGVAANPLAITSYVRNLRDQPHVGSATIQGSSRREVQGITAQSFSLRLTYERPPAAQVRTRPLVAAGGGG